MEDAFMLVTDGDGHWWLIPEEYEDEFENYLEQIYEEDDYDGPEFWRYSIDNPYRLRIISWRMAD